MRVVYFGSYNQAHPRNRILIDGLRQNGVEVVEIHQRGSYISKSWKLFWNAWQERGEYDFMIVGFPGFTIMPLARLVATAPLVFDAFLSYYDSNVFDRRICKPGSMRAGYYFFLDRLSCRLADVILLDTNEHIKYFVEKFGVKREKFRRIFIGAHDKIFKPSAQLPATSHQLQVLFWGWIIPLHGVEYILEAAKILQGQSIEFLFIGGGADKGQMMQQAAALGLGNVKFLPAVPAEALKDFIREADVCLGIFGNTQKTRRVIPNKLYEALASKKPAITADTPAAREALIDRQHCLFCRVADGQDLAKKILELKNDPALQQRLAENGYKLYQEKFTPGHLGRELLTIFEDYGAKK